MDFYNLIPQKDIEKLDQLNTQHLPIAVSNQDELTSIFDENSYTYDIDRERPEANDNKWEDITDEEQSVLGLWNTGKHIFKTSDGTTIEVEDTSKIQVKENKETGEIVIIGAENAIIKGSNSDVKISIYDSNISSIDMGNGKDNIYVENSEVEEIKGGKGDDIISTSNSKVNTIKGENGHDEINILDNSTITNIEGNNGNDDIIIENSQANSIDAGTGDDYVYTFNSNIETVAGDKGSDNIYIDSSNANSVLGGKGDDNIIIENSNNIGTVDGEKGVDNFKINSSTITNLIQEEEDHIQNESNKIELSANIDVTKLDEISIEQAQEILTNKTNQYTTKELTPEEQTQALTIDFFNQNLENMKSQFANQQASDGVVNNSYNFVKQLTDLGVSSDDIEIAIKEQEQMVDELEKALNGEIDSSFEEVFKKWTGLEYNQDTIVEYQEKAQTYSLSMNGIAKSQAFDASINSAKDLNEVMTLFNEYYGSEDLAREKLNEYLSEAGEAIWLNYGYGQNMRDFKINEDNQLVFTCDNDLYSLDPENQDPTKTITLNITDVPNVIGDNYVCFDHEKFSNEFVNNFEQTMGFKLEDLQQDVATLQIEAFGKNNSFQKLIDKYCAEQEGFADKLAMVAQFSGMGLMLAGGIVTFVCPPAGVMMMKAGQYTAMAGMFGDNALQAIDEFTSESGISKDEAYALLQETAVELALYYSGRGIGQISSGVNAQVLNATNSKALALLSEVGVDGTLSLLSDYIITGEVDLTGEGISQLLGIITGIAGSKINQYEQTKLQNSDGISKPIDTSTNNENLFDIDIKQRQEIFTPEDIDGRTDILKQQHMSTSDAKKLAQNETTYQNAMILLQKGIEPSYIKNIALLDDIQLNRFYDLTKQKGINPYNAAQIAKLQIGNYNRALDLFEQGVPASKLADTASLVGAEALNVDKLIQQGVNPYYISKLATLDRVDFDNALELMNKQGINAPTALDIVAKNHDADSIKTALEKLASGDKKPLLELTPEVEMTLLAQANRLYELDNNSIAYALEDIESLAEVSDSKLTGRQKGIQSILNKLLSKYEKGKINLNPENIDISCHDAIGDMLGTRLQMKALTKEESIEIITKALKESSEPNLTYEDFMHDMTCGDAPKIARDFGDIQKFVIDALKTKQSEELFNELIRKINNRTLNITELNNYGSNQTSYFTNDQLETIAKIYQNRYKKPLTIVTKMEECPKGSFVNDDNNFQSDYWIIKNKGSQKDSGYVSTQMNVEHTLPDGSISHGELQIRGTEINSFADIEHIPYDIRQGKITTKDAEFAEVYQIIKNMDEPSYKAYNEYLTSTYEWLRLKELGIETAKPEIPQSLKSKAGAEYRPDELQKITKEGLTELDAKIHS